MKVWTPEVHKAYAIIGCSVDKDALINIIVANGHAYALLSDKVTELKQLRSDFKIAQDCKEKCWEKFNKLKQ